MCQKKEKDLELLSSVVLNFQLHFVIFICSCNLLSCAHMNLQKGLIIKLSTPNVLNVRDCSRAVASRKEQQWVNTDVLLGSRAQPFSHNHLMTVWFQYSDFWPCLLVFFLRSHPGPQQPGAGCEEPAHLCKQFDDKSKRSVWCPECCPVQTAQWGGVILSGTRRRCEQCGHSRRLSPQLQW